MAKVYPSKIYNFVVADSVREETNKKVTIIGAIGGGNILVQGQATFPIIIPLAFYVSFKDGEGEFDAKFRITDPNNKQMGQDFSLGKITKNPDQTMQLLINFNTIPIVKPGRFKVQILLDNNVYDEDFAVGLGPVAPKA